MEPLRPNLMQRLRAAFSPLQPAQQQSERMPDLERWVMPHRSVDMADWQVARNMATNVHRPDRTKLLDLYDSILVDSHLTSAMESRVLRVQRSRFRLVRNGEARPDLLPLLHQQWFEDFLRYVAEAAFRGHTLIELGQLARPGELKDVNRIDPRNVLPWSGVVVRRQGEDTGYNFREAPLNAYLIEVGRAEDLGLLCDVAPVAIVKKYAVGSWSDYVHKYGIPPRWVKTTSRDARRFKQLETMMQNMLSSAYGVIEGDEEIQIMPTPGTDAHKVFDELIARMNSEISKRILGQDGTSDNKDASGTYGSMKVLQGVAEDRHQADKASVSYVINNELLPRLTNLGYPFAGVRFEWDALQDMSPTELVDAVSKLGMVFDIDPQHVEERTGIKILGARRMPGELGGDGPVPDGGGRQGGGRPKPVEEEGTEDDEEDGGGTASAFRSKRPIGYRASAVEADGSWPRDEVATCGVCGGGRMLDITAEAGLAPLSEEDADQVLREIEASGGLFSQHYFSHTADTLVPAFGKAWEGAKPVDPDAAATVAYTVMEANVYRFSGLKARALSLEINEIARTSKGFADFKQRVKESGKFGQFNRWRETEYANAVNSGMQASRYYSMKDRVDALPYWRYETMEDARVRPAHADLNNRVFHHDDEIWKTIYPPNGWRCRCSVRPTDDGRDVLERNAYEPVAFLGAAELGRMKSAGFAINRAQLAEVFDESSAYRTQIREANRSRKRAGLPLLEDPSLGVNASYGKEAKDQTLTAINSRPLPQAPPHSGTSVQQAGKEVFLGKDTRSFHDYIGRQWTLSRSNYDSHTDQRVKKYKDDQRHQTVHLVGDVLATPDEVWLDENMDGVPGKAGYKFIRFYEGNKTMVVKTFAELNQDGSHSMNVVTWFEMNAKSEPAHRSGLLVKRNTR